MFSSVPNHAGLFQEGWETVARCGHLCPQHRAHSLLPGTFTECCRLCAGQHPRHQGPEQEKPLTSESLYAMKKGTSSTEPVVSLICDMGPAQSHVISYHSPVHSELLEKTTRGLHKDFILKRKISSLSACNPILFHTEALKALYSHGFELPPSPSQGKDQ